MIMKNNHLNMMNNLMIQKKKVKKNPDLHHIMIKIKQMMLSKENYSKSIFYNHPIKEFRTNLIAQSLIFNLNKMMKINRFPTKKYLNLNNFINIDNKLKTKLN